MQTLKTGLKLGWICLIAATTWAQPLPGSSLEANVFKERRDQLLESMRGGTLVLKGGIPKVHNNDINQPFRQESEFYYLTGFEESNAVLVLVSGLRPKFVLFLAQSTPLSELFDGTRTSLDEARAIYGADEAYPLSELPSRLQGFVRIGQKVFYDFGDLDLTAQIVRAVAEAQEAGRRNGRAYEISFVSPHPLLDEIRLIKSPAEVELIQKAIDATSRGLFEAIRRTAPGVAEYELAGTIQKGFHDGGAQRMGFPSIVASGPNSVIGHYMANRRRLVAGDVLLLDLGAEYEYYSADVSRTLPVSGKFTSEQRAIHDVVYAAQESLIRMVAPGVSMAYLQARSNELVRQGLYRLGLVTDPTSEWQSRLWYWHGIGHWLGMDTHDCGSYKMTDGGARAFRPGMVITVEPGVYITEARLEGAETFLKAFGLKVSAEEIARYVEAVRPVVRRYQNVGVRIEDDVLVTSNGGKLLSGEVPRDAAAIEALMSRR